MSIFGYVLKTLFNLNHDSKRALLNSNINDSLRKFHGSRSFSSYNIPEVACNVFVSDNVSSKCNLIKRAGLVLGRGFRCCGQWKGRGALHRVTTIIIKITRKSRVVKILVLHAHACITTSMYKRRYERVHKQQNSTAISRQAQTRASGRFDGNVISEASFNHFSSIPARQEVVVFYSPHFIINHTYLCCTGFFLLTSMPSHLLFLHFSFSFSLPAVTILY